MADPVAFRIIGAIEKIEVIAQGRSLRIRGYLEDNYGGRNWRKMKGFAFVEEDNGYIGNAEIHWYEAHGIGRVDWKIKRRFAAPQ
jgi:hypothetical protein